MKISNILVAVDFSDCSIVAFKYALELTAVFSSRIHLLNVVDKSQIERIVEFTGLPVNEVKEKIMLDSTQALNEFISKWKSTEATCIPKVIAGVPFHEIALFARKNKVDLIIIGGYGQHGKGGQLDEIFFGSTAEKVVRLLPCPVLCVPLQS